MAFVKSLISGAPTPMVAPIIQGVEKGQISHAYRDTQSGLDQQQQFLSALQGQNGIQNLADVYGQQQATAGQLQGIADGTGPNPALQQFQNATGQNVANQAALMAGQRGAGANAGLLARQAAMQGSNIQQQAVGQGAALQAQQQLGALSALQQQQSQMAGVANSQTGNFQTGLNAYNSAAQNQQGNLLNALGQYNNAQVGATGNFNNARQAGYNSDMSLIGGIAGAASSLTTGLMGGGEGGGKGAAAAAGKYRGGFIQNYSAGGSVPQSNAGKFLAGSAFTPTPGLAMGGPISGELLAAQGMKVPGQASVKGDSLKNDTVPAMLSPGEVVIPKHVMESKNPAEMAKKFVAAIVAKQGMKK